MTDETTINTGGPTEQGQLGEQGQSGDAPESFEDALTALDETVRSLESGGLTLDESTRLYEKGIKLARFCNERISVAELKISKIRTAYGEQMRFVDDGEGESDS